MLVAAIRLRRKARSVVGLRESWISFRPPTVLFLISLWDSEEAMADFATTVPDHAPAVMKLWHEGGQSWSGLFELVGPSPTSGYWPDVHKVMVENATL